MSRAEQETPDRGDLLHWRRLRLDVEPCVYGTVVLMTVLVVALDDGIDDFAEAGQVVVGPLVATFAAHFFAAVLGRMHRQRATPTRHDVAHLAAHSAQFLWLAVVPVLVLVVGALFDLYTSEEATEGLLVAGLAFLVTVGGVGARRSGATWWVSTWSALAAGVLGLIVLALRIVLDS